MPDPTIWPLEPHTAVKHSIYEGYLGAWFPIILQHFGFGTYAEGFAGPGVYDNPDRPPGSPVRALRRLAEVRVHRPHVKWKPVRFVFVEKRADRVDQLLTELRRELNHPMPGGEYRDPVLHVVVRRGECETTLPEVLTAVGAWEAPILAVLDSFGGGSTQTLLERFAKTRGSEVLTTVDLQHFVRELDPGRADTVFGTPVWRAVAQQPARRKREFIAEHLDRATRAAGFQHVIRFGLETATGGELVLQFGTNHTTGLDRYKAALWDADPVGGARFRDPNDPDQMLLDIAPEPDLHALGRILHQHLTNLPGQTATLAQLREFTLEHTIFKKAHAAPAIDHLRRRGEVTAIPQQRQVGGTTRGTVQITANAIQYDLFGI